MKTIEVKTKKGWIRGEDKGMCKIFRSIAYAKSPSGALRWKRPQETDVGMVFTMQRCLKPLPTETSTGMRRRRFV
ncbi:MAG: hypothetical protein ACLU94_11985 [Catenibacillus sp.]